MQLPRQRAKHQPAAPQSRDTPARTGGLILSVPGSHPARFTVRAGPRLRVADLPTPAAGTQLEAALAVEAGRAGFLAEGPVPAGLAGQAEAIHGRAGLAALAAPAAARAEGQ